MTPDCIRALYNFDYEPVSTDKNSIAVGKSIKCIMQHRTLIASSYATVELRDNVYMQSDLDGFFELYDPDQVGNHPTLVSIAGGTFS